MEGPPSPAAPAAPHTGPRVPARGPASAHPVRAERWEWRRRVRADPRKRRLYRGAVGVVGVLLVLLGLLSGPLPGPGGIPLVLAGLAVLASEFHWARRLLDRARARLHAFTAWSSRQPAWLRWTGSAGAAVALVGVGYLGLVLVGVPPVVPDAVSAHLTQLPGVHG